MGKKSNRLSRRERKQHRAVSRALGAAMSEVKHLLEIGASSPELVAATDRLNRERATSAEQVKETISLASREVNQALMDLMRMTLAAAAGLGELGLPLLTHVRKICLVDLVTGEVVVSDGHIEGCEIRWEDSPRATIVYGDLWAPTALAERAAAVLREA